ISRDHLMQLETQRFLNCVLSNFEVKSFRTSSLSGSQAPRLPTMNAFTETDLIRPFFSTSFRYEYHSIFFCLAFWKASAPFSNGIVTSTTKMSLPFLTTRSGLSIVFDPGMVWFSYISSHPVLGFPTAVLIRSTMSLCLRVMLCLAGMQTLRI